MESALLVDPGLVQKRGQVLQSYIGLLRLLEATTHGRIVHAQMVGNLREPIPMPAIRGVNEARLRLLPCKEHRQRWTAGLRLPARNLPDHAIRLMLRNELLGPEINLALEVLPRTWALSPVRHKLAILGLRLPLSGSKLPTHPLHREPQRRVGFPRRGPIAVPAPQARMGDHLRAHGIEHDIPTQFQEMRVLLDQDRREPPLEEMPPTTVTSIVRLRIAAIELPHPL